MNNIIKSIRIFLFLFALLLLAGCGKSLGETVNGEVILGTTEFTEGDKIVVLLGNETNNYSGEANADNKFQLKDVVKGTYKVQYIHYKIAPTVAKKGPTPSSSSPKAYPENWTVPGGPFKLDLSIVKK